MSRSPRCCAVHASVVQLVFLGPTTQPYSPVFSVASLHQQGCNQACHPSANIAKGMPPPVTLCLLLSMTRGWCPYGWAQSLHPPCLRPASAVFGYLTAHTARFVSYDCPCAPGTFDDVTAASLRRWVTCDGPVGDESVTGAAGSLPHKFSAGVIFSRTVNLGGAPAPGRPCQLTASLIDLVLSDRVALLPNLSLPSWEDDHNTFSKATTVSIITCKTSASSCNSPRYVDLTTKISNFRVKTVYEFPQSLA